MERPIENHRGLIIRGALRVAIFVALCVAGGLAGWVQLWILLALMLLTLGVNLAVLLTRNPDLLWQRLKPDRPDKGFDRLIVFSSVPLFLALFVIAGLDVLRFRWSPLPLSASAVGAALWLLGEAPVAWTMATNPYLERTVRYQEDRGQTVITSGPYRLVRHPMYVGVLLMLAGLPLLLGSLWSFVPSVLTMGLIIARTYFEDRTLHEELPGYPEYARRTRYRLLPGLW